MQLFTLGINHHTAPLALREQVAFQPERLTHALHDLVDGQRAHEAAILSTCNRTEIYYATERPDQALDWLAQHHQLPRTQLEPFAYQLNSEQAVKHAFRVASGLDSMVLGETQILVN